MTSDAIEKELREQRALLEAIADRLGIGKTPPASIINIKDRARQAALEMKKKEKLR